MAMNYEEKNIPELLRRYCNGGENNTFRPLYAACRRIVFAAAARLSSGNASAEDLSQEIWLKLVFNICSFRGESEHWEASFGAWVRTVALRTWLDMRKSASERTRREIVQESISEEFEQTPFLIDHAPEANPMALAEADELQMQIERAIQALSAAEQAVFRARHFQDMPFKGIAAELGVTDGTVKTLHFRAMKKLQILLKNVHEGVQKP